MIYRQIARSFHRRRRRRRTEVKDSCGGSDDDCWPRQCSHAKWMKTDIYVLVRVCLCSSSYMAKLTLLGVDYLTTYHHNSIQRPYVGKMTRHTHTLNVHICRKKRRRQNVMSRHIRRRRRKKLHIYLILVQIWKKN